MREILFRGKRVDNGEWETGSLVVIRQNMRDEQAFITDKMTGYHTPVIPATVGQYTGLTDKRGVMIYEGDLIECDGYDDLVFAVKYKESFACFDLCCANKISYAPCITPVNAQRMKVIGVIHDNPE